MMVMFKLNLMDLGIDVLLMSVYYYYLK